MSKIDDFVSMRDVESLYDLMSNDEDWMVQLDAAEGLVKLGDRRGIEFLFSAEQSEDGEVRQVAREILAAPALARMRQELEADERREREARLETARRRLQKGEKVYRYKMIYLPAGDFLDEDPLSAGFDLPALDDFGLEGWEVISLLPRRRQLLTDAADGQITGAYFLLKKQVAADESGELDKP